MTKKDLRNKFIKEMPYRIKTNDNRNYTEWLEDYFVNTEAVNKNAVLRSVSNCNFTFTISDHYCTYEYPLNINSMHSIEEIANKLYKAMKVPKAKGILFKK